MSPTGHQALRAYPKALPLVRAVRLCACFVALSASLIAPHNAAAASERTHAITPSDIQVLDEHAPRVHVFAHVINRTTRSETEQQRAPMT
jgi:hypothetical protein